MTLYAQLRPCECGWPEKDCMEEYERVADCPRFVQAQEAVEVDDDA